MCTCAQVKKTLLKNNKKNVIVLLTPYVAKYMNKHLLHDLHRSILFTQYCIYHPTSWNRDFLQYFLNILVISFFLNIKLRFFSLFSLKKFYSIYCVFPVGETSDMILSADQRNFEIRLEKNIF